MANNKIQIKRSILTDITNTTPSVSAGELVFTSNGYVLAIGDPANSANVIAIGGARYPGTLTANQALVANSTSGIDKIITANLTLSSFSVNTINAVANLTNLGAASNSELTTTWAIKNFVDLKVAQASNPQGSNGQFQYNDEGVLAGTPNMTYDKTSNTITIGNSSVNVQLGYTGSVNQLAHFHGAQNAYVQVIISNANTGNAASADYIMQNDQGTETTNYLDIGINSSTYADPAFSAMGAGDSYIYAANNDLAIGTADAGELRFFTSGTTTAQIRATISAGGNVGIGNTAPNAKLQVTGTANISGLTTISANLVLGAGLTANGTGGTAGQLLTSNGTTVYWTTPAASVAGSDTQVQYNDGSTLAGASGLTFAKGTNTVTIANTLNVGANVTANTSALKVGNTTLTTTNAVFGGTIAANGGIGSSGQALISSGSANAFWSTIGNGTVTSVASANGIGGGTITGSGTLYAVGNNGIVANSTGIWAAAANGISVTAAGINVLANNGTVSNSSGVFAKAANGISVDASGINVLGSNAILSNTSGVYLVTGSTLTVNTLGVHVNSTLSIQDLTVSGNLTVSGTVTQIDTNTLNVKDNIIILADQQANSATFTDTVDAGWVVPTGNTLSNNYSGMIRVAASSTNTNPYFKLISTTTQPGATVPTSTQGSMQSYLLPYGTGGAFVANSTVVNITANSTVSVALTANSLSLSTALPATSGGTGQSSIAVGDLLVGNSTNTISKLTAGTDGYVLQINGTGVVAWNTLDGGTF